MDMVRVQEAHVADQMKRTGFKSPRKPMRKVSKKRAAYRASDEGQAAWAYMGEVKRLPCCICGAPPPSDAHHCFHGRYGGRKSSDFDVVPLCKRHHQDGPEAIHNAKERWAAKHGPDYGYIEQTRRMVAGRRDDE